MALGWTQPHKNGYQTIFWQLFAMERLSEWKWPRHTQKQKLLWDYLSLYPQENTYSKYGSGMHTLWSLWNCVEILCVWLNGRRPEHFTELWQWSIIKYKSHVKKNSHQENQQKTRVGKPLVHQYRRPFLVLSWGEEIFPPQTTLELRQPHLWLSYHRWLWERTGNEGLWPLCTTILWPAYLKTYHITFLWQYQMWDYHNLL